MSESGARDPTQPALSAAVADSLGSAIASTGSLHRNHFSLIYSADLASCTRLIIKIPKTDLRRRGSDGILPLTDDDRQMGRAEYDSLTFLHDRWRGDDVRGRWVRPLLYLDAFNAVVTERVEAEEVCEAYRRDALAQLTGRRAAGDHLIDVMSRVGAALGRLHRAQGRPVSLRGAALARRVRDYIDRLQRLRGDDPVLARAHGVTERLGAEQWSTVETTTLKGLDIRNVLESTDGSVWLLDPGKVKRTAREADLARFLLTWRILFWGSPWFALKAAPHATTDRAFLNAYWDGAVGDPRAMHAYEMKELLKHWHTGLESLALRNWPVAGAAIVRRLYIEPFYRARLGGLLDALE